MGISIAFDSLSFLIVDDNDYVRTILRTMLAGFGARQIYEAANGESGLEKLHAFNPDIAIIDWEMPVMDGPEMIRRLRNPETCKQAFVPVILLTAHTEHKRIMQARNFGVHEVLRKPVSPNALYQRIASVILVPRPFVRTATYFGPEPREELLAEDERHDVTGLGPLKKPTDEINVDDYEGNAEEAAETAA